VVDFGQTEYIDSTGLGMLLKLREFAGGQQSRVHLIKCSPQVKSILSIANFQSLLTIL
jgi:anti-anti-sigma factor